MYKSEFAAVGLCCPLVLQLQNQVWRGGTELGWGLHCSERAKRAFPVLGRARVSSGGSVSPCPPWGGSVSPCPRVSRAAQPCRFFPSRPSVGAGREPPPTTESARGGRGGRGGRGAVCRARRRRRGAVSGAGPGGQPGADRTGPGGVSRGRRGQLGPGRGQPRPGGQPVIPCGTAHRPRRSGTAWAAGMEGCGTERCGMDGGMRERCGMRDGRRDAGCTGGCSRSPARGRLGQRSSGRRDRGAAPGRPLPARSRPRCPAARGSAARPGLPGHRPGLLGAGELQRLVRGRRAGPARCPGAATAAVTRGSALPQVARGCHRWAQPCHRWAMDVTGGPMDVTGGLSLATRAPSFVTGGLSPVTDEVSFITAGLMAATGGLVPATGGLSFV